MTTVKYESVVDLDDRHNSHSLLHHLVVENGKARMDLLEVGCSSGYLGATLVAKGHRVTGVETDPEAAQAAQAVLSEVHNGDAEGFFAAHPQRRYDAMLLGDVLEHMVDPAATLRLCVAHLADGGAVAVSLPCVAHGSVRAMLLEGRWDYADYGLLDRTHLRFFSRKGMAELLSAAGLEIVRLHATTMPIEHAAREYGMGLRPESVAAVELMAGEDDLLDFQYVALARPSRSDAAALLAHNLAMPVERAPLPRRPGAKSAAQRLRIRLWKSLLQSIARRRFRGAQA
ncbi:class I SAM-dependent methyltransferase [Luteimonas sp. SX5]|uniref:Class I SAM-dependent methyltransferase n=1 Tax=Luteimonas galliterrae TaxID=2940486 RepID=A0ABT0MEM2_9GAMM|nr:class I SAM-dependent methyltransferase [Luteimonas galliterrae]MCL1633321.1 class I SAM-dependent methyltransferase [Luteimonas galliterrae]